MDKTTPFFSIVMPVYGVADYLEQTLQSVAAQTFDDFEVILVDDCSPDDSPKICDAWVKKDERMTVLHLPENGGLGNARNAGFPHVRGEYVFFMDSDDVIDANLLEQVKASLEVNRADVVVFGLLEQYYDRAGVLKQTFPVAVEKTLYLYTPEDVRREVIHLEEKTLYGYAWNKVYRVQSLRESGVVFEKITLIEDIKFNVSYFDSVCSMNVLNTTPYHYLKRIDGSLTNKFLPDYFTLNAERVFLVLEQYKNWGMCTEEVRRILANIYVRYLFSALQRNCDKRSAMNHAQRKEWLKQQYKTPLCKELLSAVQASGTLFKCMAKALCAGNIPLCLMIARSIFAVKSAFPTVFSTLKQQR